MKLHNSKENFYLIKPTANARRATVPADIGRHGGRPYADFEDEDEDEDEKNQIRSHA